MVIGNVFTTKPQQEYRHETIKSLGYLDVLEKEHQDPITHFTALAKIMDDERKTPGRLQLCLT